MRKVPLVKKKIKGIEISIVKEVVRIAAALDLFQLKCSSLNWKGNRTSATVAARTIGTINGEIKYKLKPTSKRT